MGLLTSAVFPELGESELPELASHYVLTHTDQGWSLVTHHRTGRLPGWSTPLAPHGAGPGAPVRVARAVGTKLLHELGIEVTGWARGPSDNDRQSTEFVAVTSTRISPLTTPRGIRGH